MAANHAARRAAKAQRRKAVVTARKQRESLAATLPSRVARASRLPIQDCVMQGSLFKLGVGTIALFRGASPRDVMAAVFLCDLTMGVKDVFLRELDGPDVDDFMDGLAGVDTLSDVQPGIARSLLHELNRRALALGFRPHEDFAAIEKLFGDVEAESGEELRRLLTPGVADPDGDADGVVLEGTAETVSEAA